MPENSAIETIKTRVITPEVLTAIQVFQTGEIPESAIHSHQGKGGKVFKYISHVWVTRQLNAALPHMWSFDLIKYEIFGDGSVGATCKLTIHYPTRQGVPFDRTITEMGAFDGGGGKMSVSNMVASAISRALVRCTFRAFNIGADLYEEPQEMTAGIAWKALKKLATDHGLTSDQAVEALKKAGISSEQLVDRFGEAHRVISVLAGIMSPTEEVPEDL
jgi:hypothetical protein